MPEKFPLKMNRRQYFANFMILGAIWPLLSLVLPIGVSTTLLGLINHPFSEKNASNIDFLAWLGFYFVGWGIKVYFFDIPRLRSMGWPLKCLVWDFVPFAQMVFQYLLFFVPPQEEKPETRTTS